MAIEGSNERRHLAAASDPAEAALRIVETGRDPADEHRAVTPAADVAHEVGDEPLRFSIALVVRRVR